VTLEVLEGGLLTTVQDLGRYGYERFGIPVAGAMDPFALRAANALVGNAWDQAALEITITGPVLRARQSCLIAVTGGNLTPRLNGREIPLWTAIFVRRGGIIDFGGRKSGCRAYLAVAGGFDVPPVMGSRSTYLRGSFGGFKGRALQQSDVLPVGSSRVHLPSLAGACLPAEGLPPYSDELEVQVIFGPQDDYFTEEGLATFLSGEYQVSLTADRMGYRLQGPVIAHKETADIISDGIALGTVQVPADGQPIIMMADRQTTGGYTKIAAVVSADMPLLAQCLPGKSRIRFKASTVEEAQERYRQMRRNLEREIEEGLEWYF
jgi:antagonist of KipI